MNKSSNDYNTTFAKYYDLINSEKDYKSEAVELDKVIRKKTSKRIPSLADVGCGTGNYTIEFNKLGYEVTGFDVSAPMIDIAKTKQPGISFMNQSFGLEERKFDVVVSLFNVVNSLGDYDKLIKFFQSVAFNMLEDSIFIFDMWNGVAVFKFPPENKTKIINKDNIKIVREVIPDELDYFNQISVMTYNMKVYRDNALLEELNPTLTSHFFTYSETVRALRASDLEMINVFPYSRCNDQITEKDWKINFVCRKSTNQ